MTAKPGFAVIGCGLVGRKRVAGLPENAKLEVACDLELIRAEQLVALAGSGRACTDFREAVNDPAVAAVIIATRNDLLAPVANAAIRAGKHLLLEKPGALHADQLRAVEQAAREAKLRVRLGYNHRFHPGIEQARKLVDEGVAGPLMFLRARYGHGGRLGYEREWRADPAQSGGGELIDQGVHVIDLARWFLGEFEHVSGHCATCFWDMPVDDNAFINLRTADGKTAWMHVSCTEWKNLFSFEIYGRDAKITIEGLGGSYGQEKCTLYKMLPEMGPPETAVWDYPANDTSWEKETSAFVDDILLQRDPNPGLVEGIRILEIVAQLYRASGNTPG